MSVAGSSSRCEASLSPYEAIMAHVELELELAGRAQVEELLALGERWEELIAGLPDRPPPSAASLLQRAILMHERTHIELIRLRERLIADFAVADKAQRAASGYAGTLPTRPRLSRSA